MSITEVLVPPQAVTWLPWAVQYFFYIGSAYAAAILLGLSFLFRQHTSHQLRAALALVLAISAIVGPLALTADLHQPGRAWHFFIHFTPWSWMSRGALLLPLFSVLAVLTAWLYLRVDLQKLAGSNSQIARGVSKLSLGQWQVSNHLMTAVALFTALSGLSIALYTGAEVAVVQSRSLWNQPASPLLWFVTAFSGAIGLTLLMLCLLPNRPLTKLDKMIMKRSLILSSVLALVILPLWASNSESLSLFDNQSWLLRLFILAVSFVACIAIAQWLGKTSPQLQQSLPRGKLLLSSMIPLLSCWYLRWVTMMDVQTLPHYDAGLYPYSLPLGSSGLMGIIGMAGLWLTLALMASELVNPSRPSTPRVERG